MKKIKTFLCIFFFLILIFSINLNAKATSINFSFYTYNGKKYQLSDFKNKYILLNLFVSYCPPCIVELGILNKVYENCDTSKLQIIALMMDKSGEPLLPKIVSDRKIKYLIGIAPKEIFKYFPDFSITPTTYILDTSGKRIEKITGYMNYKQWIIKISKYVKCN